MTSALTLGLVVVGVGLLLVPTLAREPRPDGRPTPVAIVEDRPGPIPPAPTPDPAPATPTPKPTPTPTQAAPVEAAPADPAPPLDRRPPEPSRRLDLAVATGDGPLGSVSGRAPALGPGSARPLTIHRRQMLDQEALRRQLSELP